MQVQVQVQVQVQRRHLAVWRGRLVAASESVGLPPWLWLLVLGDWLWLTTR